VRKQQRLAYLKKLFIAQEIKKNYNDIALVDFVLNHPSSAQKLQLKYNVRWVVIQKNYRNNYKTVQMIYDGSRAVNDDESSPIHYFLLNIKNVLVQHTINTVENLPSLSSSEIRIKEFRHPKPLWKLLGHEFNPSFEENEPQTKADLDAYLQLYVLPKTHV